MEMEQWFEQARGLFAEDREFPLISDTSLPMVDSLVMVFIELDMDPDHDRGQYPPHDPANVIERFVVLNFCWRLRLSILDPNDEKGTELRGRLCEDLAFLVNLRPIESVTESRDLRWEIANACVAGLWARAEGLCDRLYSLGAIDEFKYLTLRARVSFFSVAIADPVERLYTPPYVFLPENADVEAYFTSPPEVHALAAVLARDRKTERRDYSQAEHDRVCEAAKDFEKAFSRRAPRHPLGYVPLAWCYYMKGVLSRDSADFLRAAKEFERALAGWLPGEEEAFPRACRSLVHWRVVETLDAAGDLEGAARACRRWLDEYPDTEAALELLGRLEARRGNYHEAFNAATALLGKKPDLDWQSDLMLRLGARYYDLDAAVERFRRELAADPRSLEFARFAVTHLWPLFKRLARDTQDLWLTALHLWHQLPQEEPIPPALLRAVGAVIGMAVEAELRASVFEPFVVDARGEGSRFETNEQDDPLHGLARYINRDRGSRLTLGLMVACLAATGVSTHRLALRLHDWLKSERRGLADYAEKEGDDLRWIPNLRNRATHPSGSFGPREAEMLYSRAHALLNATAWN